MPKYRIIGNMTGNSMDAIDLVLTEFDGEQMTDICSYTRPYSQIMQKRIEKLRIAVRGKERQEIEALPDFLTTHNDYIKQIAACVNEMCRLNNIDKKTINAIGFHGKTLDHNPPSLARAQGTAPYTLQIGSGQMLADLTGIPVVYDFRSDPLMAGFEGAPLVHEHNAHIAAVEGDGIYFNGGNTSNFAVIHQKNTKIASDCGPFNEYTDNFIRTHSDYVFDKDGMFGSQGFLDKDLLRTLFNIGKNFYELSLPKSGDPAYYSKDEIFRRIQERNIAFNDAVHTLEYFAAYTAVQAMTLIPEQVSLPENIILFGGGWKNPVVLKVFKNLLSGNGFVLPEHKKAFQTLAQRFAKKACIRFSSFGDYMEARLFADLAKYKLENKPWNTLETNQDGKKIICGVMAFPNPDRHIYTDKINRAAKGWENKKDI